MEKARVPKGEKFWYISLITGYGENGISTDWDNDKYSMLDNLKWAEGNYFHTLEEAEACARKLRAVLNGADVIEMPSEEEMRNYASDVCKEVDNKGYVHHFRDVEVGYSRCYYWLKDKIVK